jgi:hypothetical protein
MSHTEKQADKSGFSLFAWAVAAIAICAVAVLMMPSNAASEASTLSAGYHANSDIPGYLPAQYVNKGPDVEPVQYFEYTGDVPGDLPAQNVKGADVEPVQYFEYN